MSFARWLLVPLALCACVGAAESRDDELETPHDDPPPFGGMGWAGEPPPLPVGGEGGRPATEPQAVRRLTHLEHALTLRDLFGLDGPAETDYPLDGPGPSGFTEAGLVSEAVAARIELAAEQIATLVVPDHNDDLDRFLGCPEDDLDVESCAIRFLERFGRRAFRRPLDAEERTAYVELYRDARTTWNMDRPNAIRLALQAFLQAPGFLYHDEDARRDAAEGAPDPLLLGPHALAARLSYFFWRSLPDAALAAAADDGTIVEPAVLEEHARRLLRDARARDGIVAFYDDWLGLPRLLERGKDLSRYPDADIEIGALKASMLAETRAFAGHVMLAGEGTLEALFLSPVSFVDANTAWLHGLSAGSSEMKRVTLDAKRRAGLLTQPSLLALGADVAVTSPVRRGRPIRERILCDHLAAPPPNVPPAPRDDTRPAREQFEAHTADPGCAGCHVYMDPLGWAFEHYDALGRWRATDADRPVDDRARFVSLKDGSVRELDGAIAMATFLAGSDEVGVCVARQWMRYALGRLEDDLDENDFRSLRGAYAAFHGQRDDLRVLMIAIATSPAFRRTYARTTP